MTCQKSIIIDERIMRSILYIIIYILLFLWRKTYITVTMIIYIFLCAQKWRDIIIIIAAHVFAAVPTAGACYYLRHVHYLKVVVYCRYDRRARRFPSSPFGKEPLTCWDIMPFHAFHDALMPYELLPGRRAQCREVDHHILFHAHAIIIVFHY